MSPRAKPKMRHGGATYEDDEDLVTEMLHTEECRRKLEGVGKTVGKLVDIHCYN